LLLVAVEAVVMSVAVEVLVDLEQEPLLLLPQVLLTQLR
jgi:hypothetical protein